MPFAIQNTHYLCLQTRAVAPRRIVFPAKWITVLNRLRFSQIHVYPIVKCIDVRPGSTSLNVEKCFVARVLLTHWGRVTHICVGKVTIIGSNNGLSPGRRKAIIWTNARILLIVPLGTNFSENLIVIQTFPFKIMRLKMSSAKWRLFRLGLNELNIIWEINPYQIYRTTHATDSCHERFAHI